MSPPPVIATDRPVSCIDCLDRSIVPAKREDRRGPGGAGGRGAADEAGDRVDVGVGCGGNGATDEDPTLFTTGGDVIGPEVDMPRRPTPKCVTIEGDDSLTEGEPCPDGDESVDGANLCERGCASCGRRPVSDCHCCCMCRRCEVSSGVVMA